MLGDNWKLWVCTYTFYILNQGLIHSNKDSVLVLVGDYLSGYKYHGKCNE